MPMRADLAAVLAGVLASGTTWLLTRSERAAPPTQEGEIARPRTERGSRTPPTLPALPRDDDRSEQSLREPRVNRGVLEARPTDPSHPVAAAAGAAVLRAGSTPDNLARVPLPDLIAVSASIRMEAERRLLTVPDETRQQ